MPNENHPDLFIEVFEHIAAEHAAAKTEDKDILKFFGRQLYNAMQTSALYSLSRGLDEISEARDLSTWGAFRERLKANTQAIFNHGDGGVEKAVVVLTTTTYAASDTPEITSDALMLLIRGDEKIFGVAAAINRGSETINFLPLMTLDPANVEPTVMAAWCLTNQEPIDPDTINALGAMYLGVLGYLDERLVADRDTGAGYGDNVKCLSLVHPEMLFGPPEWLKD